MQLINRDSPNWHAARRGKVTASQVHRLMGSDAVRQTYLCELLAERLTGHAIEQHITSAMQWGIDNQGAAIYEYEVATGAIVTGCDQDEAFVDLGWFGATPDGYVDPDGLVEIKCPSTHNFLKVAVNNEPPKDYIMQCAGQMIATRRKWVDLVFYDPRIAADYRKIITFRIHQHDVNLDEVQAAIASANEWLDIFADELRSVRLPVFAECGTQIGAEPTIKKWCDAVLALIAANNAAKTFEANEITRGKLVYSAAGQKPENKAKLAEIADFAYKRIQENET